MLLVAHAAVGGAMGATARREPRARGMVLVAVGALVSHVLMDLIPHWDYPFSLGWIILDIAASLAVFGLIAWLVRAPGMVFWGAFVACIPDLEHVLVSWLLPGPVFVSHVNWFPHGQAGLVPGLLTQAVTVGVAFWWVLRLRRQAGANRRGSGRP